ncbi:hypothetical protein AVEN_150020-1 [Araneus ventricosus]|uniref:Uncharacterized protein n=1 Tax=Araneus ventricosus TaxID=182803 RepID=A0A4Y2K2B3_ARAVE|nr:hypothetical protein AVEN_150020-1 [Araneus ventricosus]
MDSSAPFSIFSSLRVVGDTNGRPFISHLSPKGPFNDHSPTAFSPLSEQQPAAIRPTSIEVAWPVTSGLGIRVLMYCKFTIAEQLSCMKNSITSRTQHDKYGNGK